MEICLQVPAGKAGRGGSPGKDYKKLNFYSDNNGRYFLPMTSCSQPLLNNGDSPALVEVAENFAVHFSGQHGIFPSFKNRYSFKFSHASQHPLRWLG